MIFYALQLIHPLQVFSTLEVYLAVMELWFGTQLKFNISDCENLIRKMLVLDPAKRFTLAQVKSHKWMQASTHAVIDPSAAKQQPQSNMMPVLNAANSAAATATTVTAAGDSSVSSASPDPTEQILKLMQNLGIDRNKTIEVSISVNFLLSLDLWLKKFVNPYQVEMFVIELFRITKFMFN